MSDFDRYGTEPPANAPAGRAGGFDSYGAEEAPTPPTMSQAEAALHGYRTGASANFSDEIYGLSKASGLPDWMGGFRAPVGAARMLYEQVNPPAKNLAGVITGDQRSPFMKTYEEATAQRRGEQATAEKEYPTTFMAGQVGGSLALPGAASTRAATLPVRMGRNAAYGAGYGALAGAGEGTNDEERLKGAAMGGVFGGVTGGIAPAAVETALTAGRTVAAPVISAVRGAWNPQGEAARLVGGTLGRDLATDPAARTRLTEHEFSNTPEARVIDLGSGEGSTGALARAASNVSPEARQILNNTIDPRFEGQAQRVGDFLRGNLNYPNATAQQAALEAAQRTGNDAAYRRAYAAGAGNVGSTELERLASSDTVAAAMRTAASKAGDEAVVGGYGAMNPRVTFTPDGRVQFQRSPSGMPTYPDLQFWDLTRRQLSDKAAEAARLGHKDEARRLGRFATAMNEQLDQIVPEYRVAREGAARYFDAGNALEAGQNYFGRARRYGNEPTRQALADMSPAERALFQDAYGERLINSVQAPGKRQNILTAVPHLTGSPALEDELNLGLGRAAAQDLRGVRRVEGVMDRARTATQGNSTTARQQAERALFGTAGGIGAYGTYNQDPTQMTIGGITAALTAGGRHVNQNVMRNVAQILTSRDPTQIARGRIAQSMIGQSTPQAVAASIAAAQQRTQAQQAREAMTRQLLARAATGAAVANRPNP